MFSPSDLNLKMNFRELNLFHTQKQVSKLYDQIQALINFYLLNVNNQYHREYTANFHGKNFLSKKEDNKSLIFANKIKKNMNFESEKQNILTCAKTNSILLNQKQKMILLIYGPPGCAKTFTLQCLMNALNHSLYDMHDVFTNKYLCSNTKIPYLDSDNYIDIANIVKQTNLPAIIIESRVINSIPASSNSNFNLNVIKFSPINYVKFKKMLPHLYEMNLIPKITLSFDKHNIQKKIYDKSNLNDIIDFLDNISTNVSKMKVNLHHLHFIHIPNYFSAQILKNYNIGIFHFLGKLFFNKSDYIEHYYYYAHEKGIQKIIGYIHENYLKFLNNFSKPLHNNIQKINNSIYGFSEAISYNYFQKKESLLLLYVNTTQNKKNASISFNSARISPIFHNEKIIQEDLAI